MNNATTLLFQHSMNGHVADQMRVFFSCRKTLMWCVPSGFMTYDTDVKRGARRESYETHSLTESKVYAQGQA
ncbi:MAG TPA: hypothetical protein VGL94_18300 [Ktedonobacteraceae bacterium]|jgi:hypothetical protein